MQLKIIRIQLLGDASNETYDKLHAYMEGQGWKRSMYGYVPTAKTLYPLALPTATYCGDSTSVCSAIAESLAENITSKIWAKPRVLVMAVGKNWAIRSY